MKLAVIGGRGASGKHGGVLCGRNGRAGGDPAAGYPGKHDDEHVMDMDQALSSCSRTKVTKGDYKRLEDCELILITASVPETGTGTRDSYLQANRDIVTEICSKLRAESKPCDYQRGQSCGCDQCCDPRLHRLVGARLSAFQRTIRCG